MNPRLSGKNLAAVAFKDLRSSPKVVIKNVKFEDWLSVNIRFPASLNVVQSLLSTLSSFVVYCLVHRLYRILSRKTFFG
jgi:hypothetical protein